MHSDVLCLLLSILVSIDHKQLEILPVLKNTYICTLTDASMGEACSGSSATECTLALEAPFVSSPITFGLLPSSNPFLHHNGLPSGQLAPFCWRCLSFSRNQFLLPAFQGSIPTSSVTGAELTLIFTLPH